MKEPIEMIKFFAVNQKVGKRIKEGKMVTVDYPFKYTQKDLDAVREAVIEEVLEIIDMETSDPSSGEDGDEPMSYAAGWMACGFLIKDKVLELKGGD